MSSFNISKMPVKSALTYMRGRVSYKFFEDLLYKLLDNLESERLTWNKLQVFAIDGSQLTLPKTKDIVAHNYFGRAVSKYRDSYYPRMYLVHVYDVLSGLTKALTFAPYLDEIFDAIGLIPNLGKKCLCIYDRLYLCTKLINAHIDAGSYFLARTKSGSTFNEIKKFRKSKKDKKQVTIAGHKVWLVKIKNPKTEKNETYATNLPKGLVNKEDIFSLYSRRWDVETSFKDLKATLKIEQWHSKNLNGILQELFAAFWMMNFTKAQILHYQNPPKNLLGKVYSKANFKLIMNFVKSRLPKLLNWTRLHALEGIEKLINLSTERRERLKRNYPRVLKCSASPYKRKSTQWFVPDMWGLI